MIFPLFPDWRIGMFSFQLVENFISSTPVLTDMDQEWQELASTFASSALIQLENAHNISGAIKPLKAKVIHYTCINKFYTSQSEPCLAWNFVVPQFCVIKYFWMHYNIMDMWNMLCYQGFYVKRVCYQGFYIKRVCAVKVRYLVSLILQETLCTAWTFSPLNSQNWKYPWLRPEYSIFKYTFFWNTILKNLIRFLNWVIVLRHLVKSIYGSYK